MVGHRYCISCLRWCLYPSAWDWLCWLCMPKEVKEPLYFAYINYTTICLMPLWYKASSILSNTGRPIFITCRVSYAGTSLNCAGIQWWKSVSFHCWAAINLVSEMSNEEDDTPPHPPLVIRSWELGGMSNEEEDTRPHTPPTLHHQELRVKWDELVHIRNKSIILQCRHTETPGVLLVLSCQMQGDLSGNYDRIWQAPRSLPLLELIHVKDDIFPEVKIPAPT